ncbi:hypothetical protein, partial [Iamia sp.]|uniref:hypothetical protein n=1 Tax=Iamia sp. TaxID=2722710 RepID=UPI002CBD4B2B
LIVAVAALATSDSGGDDDLADGGPPSTSVTNEPLAPDSTHPFEAPSLPSIPGLDPGAPGGDPQDQARPLDEVLPELIDFVERTRGHRFRTEPVVEALADAEFEARLAEAQAGEEDALRIEGVVDQALGLIPPGTDLAEVAGAAAAAVLGFYLPETGELLVRGDAVTPFVQTVIVHELTHALDDQYVDLGRLDALSEQPDEEAFGFLALVEGTARWVETSFRMQLTAEEQAAVDLEELQFGLDSVMDTLAVPPAYIVAAQIPYVAGLALVSDIVAEDGWRSIDAAYRAPPTTSEQVLDPDLYEAAEPAVAVNAPEADGAVVAEGAIGAVDLRLLEVATDPTGALVGGGQVEPLDGFGGGRFVSWEDGEEACIRFRVVGDDAAGTAAIGEVLDTWSASEAGSGAQVDGGTATEAFTVTRCA